MYVCWDWKSGGGERSPQMGKRMQDTERPHTDGGKERVLPVR